MTDLIADDGSVANDRTVACIEHVKSAVKQHLYCLIDSGTSVTEVKAVAQIFCEAVTEASGDAILYLIEQLKGDNDEI